MNVQRHSQLVRVLSAAGVTALLIGQAACVTGRQFREAALPELESGVNLILDGVVEGLFAAVAVETPASTDDSASRNP
ncbi:MAG: hypothetical protein ACE5HE_04125 [Phycisphaerae bacterium]